MHINHSLIDFASYFAYAFRFCLVINFSRFSGQAECLWPSFCWSAGHGLGFRCWVGILVLVWELSASMLSLISLILSVIGLASALSSSITIKVSRTRPFLDAHDKLCEVVKPLNNTKSSR